MSCVFLSCYKRGTFPICGIGPSWPFTIILFIFAILCSFYMGFMLNILYATNTPCKSKIDQIVLFILTYLLFFPLDALVACGICCTLVAINILMLLMGICADPGVPPQIYRRYTKAKYGRQSKSIQKSSSSSSPSPAS